MSEELPPPRSPHRYTLELTSEQLLGLDLIVGERKPVHLVTDYGQPAPVEGHSHLDERRDVKHTLVVGGYRVSGTSYGALTKALSDAVAERRRRMEEALEFYGTEANWEVQDGGALVLLGIPLDGHPAGRAREALR